MKFDINVSGTRLIFTLNEKRLDASIAPTLKGEFLIICTPEIEELILDMSEVEFCDSSGLSSLLFAERQMRENGGRVKLAGLHERVVSLINISQLDRVFDIYDNVDEAIGRGNNGSAEM
jgi:anti-sigma B factor antagonist